MEVNEVRKKQRKLEEDVLALLRAFKEETGCSPSLETKTIEVGGLLGSAVSNTVQAVSVKVEI